MVKGKWVAYGEWCALRKKHPRNFDGRSFRTKSPNDNTRIIVGCPKGHFHPKRKKNKQCDVAMQMQSFRKRKIHGRCPRKAS